MAAKIDHIKEMVCLPKDFNLLYVNVYVELFGHIASLLNIDRSKFKEPDRIIYFWEECSKWNR